MIIFRKKRGINYLSKAFVFFVESNTIENWDLILKLALSKQVETRQGCAFRPRYHTLAIRCEQTVNKPQQPYLSLKLITSKGEKMTNVLMRMIIKQNMLTVTGGLERECCGEERTTGGIPLAGLVPGPLPPANWHRQRKEEILFQIQTRQKGERLE